MCGNPPPTPPSGRGVAGRPAFTLFEVIVVIGVLLALSGSVFGFLWTVIERRREVVREATRADGAAVLVERLERDLFWAIAGGAAGVGIQGSSAELTILTRGVIVPGDGASPTAAGAALGDLQRSEYSFDGPPNGQVWLKRSIEAAGRGGGAGGDGSEVLVSGLARVRFRYHDGTSWLDSFDTGSHGGLPAAVEVAVWFAGQGGGRDAPAVLPTPTDAAARRGDGGTDRPKADRLKGDTDRRNPGDRPSVPQGEPDRRRIIVVPDGPEAGWRPER